MPQLDIIGDLHGCSWELLQLLDVLGYRQAEDGRWSHAEGRQLAFLGDLIDRGPDSVGALALVEQLIESDCASIAAVGNHDYEIYHGMILGRPTKVFYGLQKTLDQVAELGATVSFAQRLVRVLEGAPAFSCFPEDRLLLVHAALRPDMLDAEYAEDWSDVHSQMALYGEMLQVDGEPFPRKVYHWVDSWSEDWQVVYGHDVVSELPIIRGQHRNVIGIETGASYGGRLTALRWPEREFVSISAREVYPEHAEDFPDEEPGLLHRYSWDEALQLEHRNTQTLHYLHGRRKTPEMSVPRSIRVELDEVAPSS